MIVIEPNHVAHQGLTAKELGFYTFFAYCSVC